MDCTLYIPHLLPPREQGEALWQTVDAPELKRMLARADFRTDAAADGEAWLCAAFGVTRQFDWPLAPLLAAHENLDATCGYWLNATPVHLETRRTSMVLTDPAALELSIAESAALVALLGSHLAEEGITLHAPHPGQWLLRTEASSAVTTSSLGNVIGRDVRTFLPRGPDSPRWHRILTEIQMLLHTHPVTDAREARGQSPVNSVWLWGGGTLPARTAARFTAVWSDDGIVSALARHGGCRCEPLTTHIMPEALIAGSHLFSFESLETNWREGNAQAWSDAVTALHRDWFIPLMNALKTRQMRTLTLINVRESGMQTFIVSRSNLLKFWRKNKYLE